MKREKLGWVKEFPSMKGFFMVNPPLKSEWEKNQDQSKNVFPVKKALRRTEGDLTLQTRVDSETDSSIQKSLFHLAPFFNVQVLSWIEKILPKTSVLGSK